MTLRIEERSLCDVAEAIGIAVRKLTDATGLKVRAGASEPAQFITDLRTAALHAIAIAARQPPNMLVAPESDPVTLTGFLGAGAPGLSSILGNLPTKEGR